MPIIEYENGEKEYVKSYKLANRAVMNAETVRKYGGSHASPLVKYVTPGTKGDLKQNSRYMFLNGTGYQPFSLPRFKGLK